VKVQLLKKSIRREAHDIIVKTGAIIDASVIDTPLKPKGKTTHKATQDREDLEEVEAHKEYADSVDKEASWLKKQDKYRYGYKKHYVTDNEGLVLGVLTTKADTNEVLVFRRSIRCIRFTRKHPSKSR